MFKRMTASQKRGALVLMAIVIAVAGWQWRLSQIEKSKTLPQPQKENAESHSFAEAENTDYYADKRTDKARTNQPKYQRKPVLSEPIELNSADTTELMRVKGIGPAFAKRIVKYRNLIGGFNDKSQLQKIYGIDPERYAEIAPQVRVDAALRANYLSEKPNDKQDFKASKDVEGPISITSVSEPQEKPYAPKAPGMVNVNTADSATLVTVSGIGPKTASTILKYRNRILFFHSLDQLAEVWGIRPENLERMQAQLEIGNTDALPHLDINAVTGKELGRHMYIDYKIADRIVAYREQHGPFQSRADLEKIIGLEAAFLDKIEPYLRF